MIPAELLHRRRRSILIVRIAIAILGALIALSLCSNLPSALIRFNVTWEWLFKLIEFADSGSEYSVYALFLSFVLLAYGTYSFRFEWPRPARWMPYISGATACLMLNEFVYQLANDVIRVFPNNPVGYEARTVSQRVQIQFGTLYSIGLALSVLLVISGLPNLLRYRCVSFSLRWFVCLALFFPLVTYALVLVFWSSSMRYLAEIIIAAHALTLSAAIVAMCVLFKVCTSLPIDLMSKSCFMCGYPMEGIHGGRCPECGTDVKGAIEQLMNQLAK